MGGLGQDGVEQACGADAAEASGGLALEIVCDTLTGGEPVESSAGNFSLTQSYDGAMLDEVGPDMRNADNMAVADDGHLHGLSEKQWVTRDR